MLEAWETIRAALARHPAAGALVLLAAYLAAAKLADLFLDRVLRRLAGLTPFRFDDRLLAFAHRPLVWTVALLGGLHVAARYAPGPPWGAVLLPLLKSAILVVWWAALVRAVTWASDRRLPAAAAGGKVGVDFLYLVKNVVRVALVVLGLLWLLAIWRVNLTPLFASAGIVGIAVALAAKETLANFFGGLSIFTDRIFQVGDYIILESGERGEVMDIGVRSTRIKTRDDVQVTIPNAILAGSKIINESAPVPRFRIRVPVGVAYGSDIEEVERLLLQVAAANEAVVAEPAPRVRLRAFGDSSLDFELLCWVREPALRGLVVHQLLTAVYRTFAAHGVVIPFPQRDVHLVHETSPPGGPSRTSGKTSSGS
ncbi:mechanosensitive ion channel family protein [Dissulfurirhabdus thermomarina]|uniref:Mechanosensitive ion channel family protein n=1 Tax=Dissulfurirhabdus thermomarina TaxID=1765737 RepID=A0A6N9TRJ1_DISTH|nr:mechanosensitive ion channel family protein [Dissulfurirhabdus thermomarina]NMX22541.1 mechanosensitive ion channel family protein [Dissulfurirhabdus thermomarina]